MGYVAWSRKYRRIREETKSMYCPYIRLGGARQEQKEGGTGGSHCVELRKKVREEEHLEMHGGSREGMGMGAYFRGPMPYAKNADTAKTCWGSGPARKRQAYW